MRPKSCLVKFKRQPEPEVVDMLAQALKKAKAGQVLAVGVVLVGPGGAVGTMYASKNHYHELNSGAARLAHRICNEED
jgi:hypothetical protein